MRARHAAMEAESAAERKHCLIVNYSAVMAKATLSRALYADRYLLPVHLHSNFVVAWRVPRKLSALLALPLQYAVAHRRWQCAYLKLTCILHGDYVGSVATLFLHGFILTLLLYSG